MWGELRSVLPRGGAIGSAFRKLAFNHDPHNVGDAVFIGSRKVFRNVTIRSFIPHIGGHFSLSLSPPKAHLRNLASDKQANPNPRRPAPVLNSVPAEVLFPTIPGEDTVEKGRCGAYESDHGEEAEAGVPNQEGSA